MISRQRHAKITLAMFRSAIDAQRYVCWSTAVAKSSPAACCLLVCYRPLASFLPASTAAAFAGLLERRELEIKAVDNRW